MVMRGRSLVNPLYSSFNEFPDTLVELGGTS